MRLRDRRVQISHPVRLTCQAWGNPDPEISWFKDGKEIVADGTILELIKINIDRNRCYKVQSP